MFSKFLKFTEKCQFHCNFHFGDNSKIFKKDWNFQNFPDNTWLFFSKIVHKFQWRKSVVLGSRNRCRNGLAPVSTWTKNGGRHLVFGCGNWGIGGRDIGWKLEELRIRKRNNFFSHFRNCLIFWKFTEINQLYEIRNSESIFSKFFLLLRTQFS